MSWMNGPGAYLTHLLLFSLPVLAAMVSLSAVLFRGRFRALLKALLPPIGVMTAWLVAADHWAIEAGIWHFHPERLLGLRVAKVPIEEVLFFLITNSLVAFGMALFAHRKLMGRET